jgi:hypothetical protein
MKKRTTENIQPEPVLNGEQQTIDSTSRQTIANTNVIGRLTRFNLGFPIEQIDPFLQLQTLDNLLNLCRANNY